MAAQAYPDALPPQHKLHWYVIERVLGQGGFGITYLARDTNLDQEVAIKEYLPVEVATRRPDATVSARTSEHDERYRWGLERFIREARTLARFDHPNIVRVLSVFELNGTAYMVMRFEEGETLAATLERKHALSEADLMRVLMPILDGLELVHNAGFIHLDIKPDNIHLRSDGSPVLLDFGSARYALGHSRTVTILVAPGYAPFEQYYSSGENQGPWTDIYSLGATCYRAIAGRAPLDAIARSKGILGSTQEILVPATAVGTARYSERFLKAVDHALAFAEKERPQSIAEWRKELSSGKGAPASKALVGTAATRIAVPAQSRIAPMVWGGVGAVVVIAAFAVSFVMYARQPAQKESAKPPVADAEALRRLSALEQKMADEQQRLAEERRRLAEEREQAAVERKRLEQERAKPAAAPVTRARVEQPKPAAAEPKVAEAQVAVVAPPPVTTPAPAPDPMAVADRAIARGNFAEAAAALKPLAERGNAQAMVRLGDLYSAGQGVERSDELALRMYRGASDRGNGDAHRRMGDLYTTGRGVPQNNFQAFAYYMAAVQSGNTAAKGEADKVSATLQAVEVQQAMKLAERIGRSKER